MLRPRIIPCLLLQGGGLVKTFSFANPKYVGDPLNAVRIFNEKEVDELIVLDIDATVHGRSPDYSLIANLAAECRMPLCYGGGIKTVSQVEHIISLGVEKIAISSAALSNPDLISQAATRVGNQSIVVVMDVKCIGYRGNFYQVFTHNGTTATLIDPIEFAIYAQRMGAGEIVLNSIERDGMQTGYDMELVEEVRNAVSIPVTVLGGAGSYADIEMLIRRFGIIGAAAGSIFVFKGKYRAVLIQYPDHEMRDLLAQRQK
jgi:cyclase